MISFCLFFLILESVLTKSKCNESILTIGYDWVRLWRTIDPSLDTPLKLIILKQNRSKRAIIECKCSCKIGYYVIFFDWFAVCLIAFSKLIIILFTDVSQDFPLRLQLLLFRWRWRFSEKNVRHSRFSGNCNRMNEDEKANEASQSTMMTSSEKKLDTLILDTYIFMTQENNFLRKKKCISSIYRWDDNSFWESSEFPHWDAENWHVSWLRSLFEKRNSINSQILFKEQTLKILGKSHSKVRDALWRIMSSEISWL